MKSFAVIVLKISTVLQNIYFEEYVLMYINTSIINISPDISIQKILLISKSVSCGKEQYHYYLPPSCCKCLKINETSRTGSINAGTMHCSILDNRFSELKKSYDGKFSKPSVENFEIWLLSLKETFFDAHWTLANMHRARISILCLLKGDDSSIPIEKMDSFPKAKIFPFWK